ncbi:MAG TPA: hypothetical protein DCY13_25235 [Verrucomicrobiales bacterium]|nr:hypothetical protein [Verrucomicrobiales bacterium]
MRFGVVILAAGRSSRMGRPKLLLPWGDTTILGHLVKQWQALGAEQIVVVHAEADMALQVELARLVDSAACGLANPAAERGMFGSIVVAASWGGWQAGLSHVVIALGDQPHLELDTLKSLLDFAATAPDGICQPSLGGRPRHPVVLAWRHFRRVAETGAGTLRDFLEQNARHVRLLPSSDEGLDLDLDRPEDYQRAVRMSAR